MQNFGGQTKSIVVFYIVVSTAMFFFFFFNFLVHFFINIQRRGLNFSEPEQYDSAKGNEIGHFRNIKCST